MKYYIIAGEASGDLHGANLMHELKKLDTKADFRFWGGDKMQEQGGELVRHYRNHDFMGFVQVVKNIRKILGNMSFCKKDIAAYKPDVVILVDFPGFNLPIANFVKNKLGIRTFFYISPTIWAWKENRIKKIKRSVDRMFVILPFEKQFYKERHNYEVDFCGHPLLDQIAQTDLSTSQAEFIASNQLDAKPIVAVLPGSRTAEIEENLKCMQSIAPNFSNYQFVIAGMDRFNESFYRSKITAANVSVVFNQTYQLIKLSKAAIVVSGTATLETALIGTPEVLVYKTSQITWSLGSLFVKLKYLGLPNLIMDAPIIPELLQKNMHPESLQASLESLLFDSAVRNKMLADFEALRNKLGGAGASERIATKMWEYLQD